MIYVLTAILCPCIWYYRSEWRWSEIFNCSSHYPLSLLASWAWNRACADDTEGISILVGVWQLLSVVYLFADHHLCLWVWKWLLVCKCWQWQIGAFSVFLAWFNFIFILKDMPCTAIPIHMFIRFCITFLKLVKKKAEFTIIKVQVSTIIYQWHG